MSFAPSLTLGQLLLRVPLLLYVLLLLPYVLVGGAFGASPLPTCPLEDLAQATVGPTSALSSCAASRSEHPTEKSSTSWLVILEGGEWWR